MGDGSGLFDEYLEAALRGEALDPVDFARQRGRAGEAALAEIQALHRMIEAPTQLEPGRAALDAGRTIPIERLGEFRLIRPLGGGGMGAVYLAEQESLGRAVALKVMRAEYRSRPEAIERFRREARALGKIDHPGIVRVVGAGEDQGMRYLAMALVPGEGLDEILAGLPDRGGRVSFQRLVRWTAQIARALETAHAQGVLHRDVKPSNIRITPDGRAVLLDFGLARDSGLSRETMTGDFLGTPAYASPEQLEGNWVEVDVRTDVYSLGATLFHGLSGEVPPRSRAFDVAARLRRKGRRKSRSAGEAISADLAAVVAGAMEYFPADRYSTAAAFANDLEALLEFRPIAARPHGFLTRGARWARRHPSRVVAIGAVYLAVLAIGVSIFLAGERARDEARAEARVALGRAREGVDSLRRDREASRLADLEFEALQRRLGYEYLSDEDVKRLDGLLTTVARGRGRRETMFLAALEALRDAERLDPGIDALSETRAELYAERGLDVASRRDPVELAFYRERIESEGGEGEWLERFLGVATLSVSTEPEGAEVHLFRYEEASDLVPGGDPRLVPVPHRGTEGPVVPGTWALRVVKDAGDFRAGDLVVEVGGRGFPPLPVRPPAGVRATVYRDGGLVHAAIPEGLAFLPTAAPLLLSSASRLGTTPIELARVASGPYLVVAGFAGRETRRVLVDVRRDVHVVLGIRLAPEGAAGDGFVPVTVLSGCEPFYLQDREVTAAEYLSFVNAPSTQSEIRGAPTAIRFPRDPGGKSYWPRDERGLFSIPAEWSSDWPVFGVSFFDAQAFAAWKTECARYQGLPHRYRLPTRDEWRFAAGASDERTFPFGMYFRPRWVKSNYSRPDASRPEPVASYPIDESREARRGSGGEPPPPRAAGCRIWGEARGAKPPGRGAEARDGRSDESPYAVYDLSGSVSEWVDHWWLEDRGLRQASGGAWATGDWKTLFTIDGGLGARPEETNGMVGFRLALDIVPEDR